MPKKRPIANTTKEAVALRKAAHAWVFHGLGTSPLMRQAFALLMAIANAESPHDITDPEDVRGARLNDKLLKAALAYARRAKPTAYDRVLKGGL